jgi:hypothetical protein
MQVDDDGAWQKLRRDYETSAQPLKALAARLGVSVQRIVARARREGWKARPSGRSAMAIEKPATAARAERRSSALPGRRTQRVLIARLYQAISLKLEHMEKRMAGDDVRSAQDEERESRALATLITNFEKVTEAVAELDKQTEKPGASGTAADAERMRREIAERLERLGGIGPAGGGFGSARS